jgi:bacterioferritin (cytochrome b1)
MGNNIKKFGEYMNEDLNNESENVLDYISSLGIDVTTDDITKEQIEDILIDISDGVDDEKYHWVETELLKLIK